MKQVTLAGVALIALLVAGCANVRTIAREFAVTATPTEQQFGLAGVLRIPAGSALVLATVDDAKSYCSQMPVAFIPGEAGRGACFFDTNNSGYFDRWMMLGKLGSITAGGVHIPYSVMPANGDQSTIETNRAARQVDVDWNKRSAGEGSNAATEDAIRGRDAAHGLQVCAPTALSDYCSKLTAERIAAQQIEAEQVGLARHKQEGGKKLTATESALLSKVDADAATARMAAQAAQAQAVAQAATYALQRQADEAAYQQRRAACTAAADLVALSIRSFLGGIVAGTATGAACMQ